MRTKRVYSIIVLMMLGISILTSCKKEPIGSVSGLVTVYDATSPLVKTPMEGVKLFLINTDFKLDSVDYANNVGAIVDSAVTGADGKYQIAGIPDGNWAVIPIPDTIMYRFELESALDSVRFNINKELFTSTVNFKAAKPNSTEDGFHVRLTIINRGLGGTVAFYRPVFLFNIVPTIRRVKINNQLSSTADDITLNLHFGIFCSFYAVSNNFVVKARDEFDKPQYTYWITYDYFNTPAYSHWQIDWPGKTIYRVD